MTASEREMVWTGHWIMRKMLTSFMAMSILGVEKVTEDMVAS